MWLAPNEKSCVGDGGEPKALQPSGRAQPKLKPQCTALLASHTALTHTVGPCRDKSTRLELKVTGKVSMHCGESTVVEAL